MIALLLESQIDIKFNSRIKYTAAFSLTSRNILTSTNNTTLALSIKKKVVESLLLCTQLESLSTDQYSASVQAFEHLTFPHETSDSEIVLFRS